MKQVFVSLIITVLLLGLALSASAAQSTASLSAPGTVKAGEWVELTVTLTGATAVRGIAVVPTYDTAQFTLEAGEWQIAGILSDFSVEKGDGVIAFADPTEVSGDILTFTLQVNSQTPAGTYTVGCSVVVSDESGNQTLPVQTTVTVDGEAAAPGDVDGDGQITSTDARLVLQYYAGKIPASVLDVSVADVDGDGQITSTDARLILQKYAGKIEDFPI